MSLDWWRAVTENLTLRTSVKLQWWSYKADRRHYIITMCLMIVSITESEISDISSKSIIYSQHQPQRRRSYPWDCKRVWRICKHRSVQVGTLCFQSVLIRFWIVFLLLQVKVLQEGTKFALTTHSSNKDGKSFQKCSTWTTESLKK